MDPEPLVCRSGNVLLCDFLTGAQDKKKFKKKIFANVVMMPPFGMSATCLPEVSQHMVTIHMLYMYHQVEVRDSEYGHK